MSQPVSDESSIVRELNRSPAEVWHELTSAEGFERWMGPGSTIEPEPDGDLIAADPESGVPRIGTVIDVDPGRRLQWVWRPLGGDPDSDGATEVLVELEPTTHPLPRTNITVTEWPSTRIIDPLDARAMVAAGCSC